MHLIDKHMFPKDYDFYVVNDGIDYRSSILRSGRHRRRSSAAQHKTELDDRARKGGSSKSKIKEGTSREEVAESKDDTVQQDAMDVSGSKESVGSEAQADIDALTGAISSLTFVPSSV